MGLKRAQNGLKTGSKRVQTQILLTSIRVELSATKGCLKAEKINTLYYYFFVVGSSTLLHGLIQK